MTNLRKLAKGQVCEIRLPGICNGNPETTVLAHVRMIGLSGTGLKSPDLFAAYACSDCHDAVDGRTNYGLSAFERRLALLEGVIRTQAKLIELDLLHW